MLEQLKILPQYIVPQHVLSRFIGWFADCRQLWIKNFLIDKFIKYYDVNMDEAIQSDPRSYENFNQFFTRKLRSDARVISRDQNAIICPVDGTISEIGNIANDKLLQAKGHYYCLADLLGGNSQHASMFNNGNFATFYLAPKDYHRIHMPISGKLLEMIYIPGTLFSVNPRTTRNVSKLFARNERVVAIFDTEIGPMAVVLVGAMIVASICTVWSGLVNSPRYKQIRVWRYENIVLNKGDELGHFQLGSTVIVLFGVSAMKWLNTISAGKNVTMGSVIGEKI